MAAEYEVNIKINTQQIERELKRVDKAVSNIGKGRGGKKQPILALPSTEMLNATARKIQSLDKVNRKIALRQREINKQGRDQALSINTLVKTQEKRARLLNKINEMEAKGLNVSKLRKQLAKATTEQSNRRFGSAEKEFRILEKSIRLEQSKLRILKEQRKGFASSPVGGTPTMMGSPAQIAASARAGGPRSPIGGAANIAGSPAALKVRRQRLEQVGLGAGFPLLFGGGPGAVLGGAAGGLTGSFGAQIALSAAGQLIDQFVGSIVNTGKAFGSLSETLELVRERSLFTTKESEELARQLEELGDVEGLAELATIELASKIGSEGIEAFQDLETEVDEFDRLVSNLTISLQAFLAGPLAGFLSLVNSVLGRDVSEQTVRRLTESLQTAEGVAAFEKRAKELAGTETRTIIKGQGVKETKEVMKTLSLEQLATLQQEVARGEFGESNLLSRPVRVTQQDRETIKPPKPKRVRAPRESRVPQLQIELQLAERLSVLNNQILEAKRQEDFVREATLRKEIVLEQQAAKIAQIGLEKIPQDEKELKAAKVVLETKDKILGIDYQLSEQQRVRQESFDKTIENLEHQLKLAQATSEEERERLRIEKELKKLKSDGMSELQIEQVENLMRQLAAENAPLNQFIKQSVESLDNLQQHAVQVSQGIGNAIGNSLVNGMQNLITGAQSVKEVFADMLKSIANVLAQQAAQMIATYIAIGVARAFAGMGTSGGDPNSAAVGEVLQGGGFTTGNMADQAIAGTFSFASGGYVSGPTRALVGEGGEPEYVIPESKMRESMARYSRGARGGSVIPEAGGSGTSGEGGGTAVAAPIDVRYTVERINNVDYVTAEEFQAGMRQAANQGAKQGEQQTLKRLQMSSGTRRRLGM